jgi:hypothetical protein
MELATFVRSDSRSPRAHPIGDVIRGVVLDADRTAPRSLQVAIGPSEVGVPLAETWSRYRGRMPWLSG